MGWRRDRRGNKIRRKKGGDGTGMNSFNRKGRYSILVELNIGEK